MGYSVLVQFIPSLSSLSSSVSNCGCKAYATNLNFLKLVLLLLSSILYLPGILQCCLFLFEKLGCTLLTSVLMSLPVVCVAASYLVLDGLANHVQVMLVFCAP